MYTNQNNEIRGIDLIDKRGMSEDNLRNEKACLLLGCIYKGYNIYDYYLLKVENISTEKKYIKAQKYLEERVIHRDSESTKPISVEEPQNGSTKESIEEDDETAEIIEPVETLEALVQTATNHKPLIRPSLLELNDNLLAELAALNEMDIPDEGLNTHDQKEEGPDTDKKGVSDIVSNPEHPKSKISKQEMQKSIFLWENMKYQEMRHGPTKQKISFSPTNYARLCGIRPGDKFVYDGKVHCVGNNYEIDNHNYS